MSTNQEVVSREGRKGHRRKLFLDWKPGNRKKKIQEKTKKIEKTEENPQNDTFSRGQDTRLFFGHFSRPVTVYSFLLKEIDEDAPLGRRLSELGKALGAYANEKFIHRAGYKPYSAWGNFYNLSEFAYHTLNIPATTFETSYYEAGEKVLTIEQYHKIGAIFAEQMCEFAKRG